MKEQAIQAKILKLLKDRGAYTVKVVTGNKSGIPDIIACYKGRFIGIEVKTPETKNNVSKLQKHNLDQICKAKGFDLVAWDIKEVESLLIFIDILEAG